MTRVSEEDIQKLVDMGFEREVAAQFLTQAGGNIDRAIGLAFEPDSGNPDPETSIVPIGAPASNHPPSPTQAVADTASRGIGVDDEQELQRAIQASLSEGNLMASTNRKREVVDLVNEGGLPTRGDEDLSKAIEQSLQDFQGQSLHTLDAIDPYSRRREDGRPVGLKNIGNTCYFNSLIQMYFHIPSFRHSILSLDGLDSLLDKAKGVEEKNRVKLICELQKLCGLLVGSNRKYVDPSGVIRALLDDFGKPVQIGNQEDVGEFNLRLLSQIEEGLTAVKSLSEESPDTNGDRKENNSNAVDNMKWLFGGKLKQQIDAVESDGTVVDKVSEEGFSSLILDVSATSSDLHCALDSYCNTSIDDYMTPKNHVTLAQKSVTVETFPPALSFQLQRVSYDATKGEAVKNNLPFAISSTIYMDRYLEKHKEDSKERRRVVDSLRNDKLQLEQYLNFFENYNNANLGLDKILSSSCHFLEGEINKPTQDSAPEVLQPRALESAKATLDILAKRAAEEMTDLKSRVDTLQKKMSSVFESTAKEEEYHLHAVLIHSGMAGSGHYWAYLYDHATGKWQRYNDMHVGDVEEDQVFTDAQGHLPNTSAYYLMYLNSKMVDMCKNSPPLTFGSLSPDVGSHVSADIAAFTKELEDWDKKEADKKNRQMDEVERRVHRKLEELETIVASIKDATCLTPEDPRIDNNFPLVALAGGQKEYCLSLLLRVSITELGCDEEIAEGVRTRLLGESTDFQEKEALVSSWVETMKIVTVLIVCASKRLLRGDYDQCLAAISFVRDFDAKLPEGLRRSQHIVAFTRRVCQGLSVEAGARVEDDLPKAINLALTLSHWSTHLLDSEDESFGEIQQRWILTADEIQERVESQPDLEAKLREIVSLVCREGEPKPVEVSSAAKDLGAILAKFSATTEAGGEAGESTPMSDLLAYAGTEDGKALLQCYSDQSNVIKTTEGTSL